MFAHPPRRPTAGFTLIEVLVALAVVAIALTAILGSSGTTVSSISHLRDSTLAQWVAENRMAELRLEGEWPSTGRNRGESEMAGREWHWEMTVEETQDDDLRRIEIAIRTHRDAERSVHTLVGFMGRPMMTNPPAFVPPPEEIPDDGGGGVPPPPPPGSL